MERVLTKRYGKPDSHRLATVLADGGYEAARRALAMEPEAVVAEVKKACLRGRGGAGFPTGVKWTFMPKPDGGVRYLAVNSDESEPGTFKDRSILMQDPHLLLEGIIIACHALRADCAVIYTRGEMWDARERLWEAILDARRAGLLGVNHLGSGRDLRVIIATGAGAYVCGEETAMLNSIEGKRGEPRYKPPFPATNGIHGRPTTVNNVETLANIPGIIAKGADWFLSLGIPGDGGTRLFGISGPVVRPGIYERPQGYNLKRLIEEDAGGLLDGQKLQAVIPGGSSCGVMRADEIDLPHSFEGLRPAKSTAGSGGVIVIPERACMVAVLANLTHFYAHESCGQCTPCREGTHWLDLVVRKIERGEGTMQDLADLRHIARNMSGTTICALSDAVAVPVLSFLDKFEEDFVRHIEQKGCPKGGAL